MDAVHVTFVCDGHQRKPIQMIELGSGKVLTGLAKKIDSQAVPPLNVNSIEDLKKLEAIVKKDA